MTLKEIKDLFGIDITEKNQNRYVVYLRVQYIKNELAKGRKKYPISIELNLNHATVHYHVNMLPEYEKIPEFNEIEIAFKNKDLNLFKDIEYRMLNVNYKKNKGILGIRSSNQITKLKRWSVDRIINALRLDNKSYLWNKEMNIFDDEDYKILRKYENNVYNAINGSSIRNNV